MEDKPKRVFSAIVPTKTSEVVKIPERKSIKREKTTKSRHTRTYNETDVNIIPVYKNSHIIINKEVPLDIGTVLQVERVLEIDRDYPNQIYGFNPPLFKDFIDEETNTIDTHVKVGDTVILKNLFKGKVNTPRKVKSLYFRALNDFTVVVAQLEDNDFYTTYYLEKV